LNRNRSNDLVVHDLGRTSLVQSVSKVSFHFQFFIVTRDMDSLVFISNSDKKHRLEISERECFSERKRRILEKRSIQEYDSYTCQRGEFTKDVDHGRIKGIDSDNVDRWVENST